MQEEILQKFGLTSSQVKVYLALLKTGPVTAGIIIKSTGLHRAYVYDILEKLMDKGLVSFAIKTNRKYFEASDPKKFLEILEEQKQEIKQKEQNLKDILPTLLKEKHETEEIEATIYKGKKGLQTIFNDMLASKEILVLGAGGKFREALKYYYPGFIRQLVKLKIKLKVIYAEENRKIVRKDPNMIVKFIPKEYTSPLTIYIYRDKVTIIHWAEENLLGITLKERGINDSFRKYFELLWSIAKK